MTLTPRKQQILDTIHDMTANNNGVAPSLDEIGAVMQLSKTTVWEHVDELAQGGYLFREKHCCRSVSLSELGRRSLSKAVCAHCGK